MNSTRRPDGGSEGAAQIYGSLTCTTYREGYQDPENDIEIIAKALQQARQEALREAVVVAMKYREQARQQDLSGGYTSELIATALDRLATEGVKG